MAHWQWIMPYSLTCRHHVNIELRQILLLFIASRPCSLGLIYSSRQLLAQKAEDVLLTGM